MAGWRKGLAASLIPFFVGLASPKDISSGTTLSSDNSKLENEVKTESFSNPQDEREFDFVVEHPEREGKEYEVSLLESGYPISVCECKDVNSNGVYSVAKVYNSVGFFLSDPSMDKDPRGKTRYHFKESFWTDASLGRNGNTFIQGIDSFKAKLISSEPILSYRVAYDSKKEEKWVKIKKKYDQHDKYYYDVLGEFSNYEMDSKSGAVNALGRLTFNKASDLVGACNQLSQGNKKPIKDFLEREANAECNVRLYVHEEDGQINISPAELNYEVMSGKVWDGIYSPGMISSYELNKVKHEFRNR